MIKLTLAQIAIGEDLLDMTGNRWRCVEKVEPDKAATMQCKKQVLLARKYGNDILVVGYAESEPIIGSMFNVKEEVRLLSPKSSDYAKYSKILN